MGRPRVLITDDHEAVRQVLGLTVQPECEVVGEATNGEEAIAETERLHPDLVLMDVSMPVMGGFEAARQMRERFPQLNIIFVSQHAEKAFADEAFRVGAKGYVLKRAVGQELTDAIRAVLAGGWYLSPCMAN